MIDRLIELIKNAPVWKNGTFDEACEFVADHLIENGVILLPVKVGKTVYVITSQTSDNRNLYIFEDTITHYRIVEGCTIMCFENHLGEPNWKWNNVFLTKEEAEKALRGEGE